MDLARLFGKPSVFGVGMVFLPVVFWPLLAFSEELDNLINHNGAKTVHWESVPEDEPKQQSNTYREPEQETVKDKEASQEESYAYMSADDAAEKLQSYKKLLEAGLLTQEEFDRKKAEVLKKTLIHPGG